MKGFEMKNLLLAPALASVLFAGAASAATFQFDVPDNIRPSSSTLTRAEVNADVQVWRLAGLEDLNRGERSPDTNSYEYRQAVATYQYLRASPQFALLVQQLQANPNTTVLAHRTSGPLLQSSN
jgi:hypothetical protein